MDRKAQAMFLNNSAWLHAEYQYWSSTKHKRHTKLSFADYIKEELEKIHFPRGKAAKGKLFENHH